MKHMSGAHMFRTTALALAGNFPRPAQISPPRCIAGSAAAHAPGTGNARPDRDHMRWPSQ